MNFINVYPNAVSEEFCTRVLETFKQQMSFLKVFMKYSEGATTYALPVKEDPWNSVLADVLALTNARLKDYLKPVENLIPHKYEFRSMTMLRNEPGAEVPLHYDEEVSPNGIGKNFIFLIYLNSPTVGGELIFPLQKEVIRPMAGLMVIFPTFFTHPHHVVPSLMEERYCLRIEYQIENRVWHA